MSVEGFVLAGAMSRRFGRPKALLELAGEPLARRAVRLLRLVASEVCVVSSHPEWFEGWGVATLVDPEPGGGPLGGIWSALRNTAAERALVVPCDMPLLTARFLEALLARAPAGDAAVAADETGRWIPVLACLRVAACRPAVEQLWSAGERRAVSLFRGAGLQVVTLGPQDAGCQPCTLWDVDTPQDFRRVKEQLRLRSQAGPSAFSR